MEFFYLQESALSTGITVFFGIIGFIVMVALLVYFKAGLSSLTNTRYFDRHGKTVINPNTFKDINDFVSEKVIDAKDKIIGIEVKTSIRNPVSYSNNPLRKININFDGIVAGYGIGYWKLGAKAVITQVPIIKNDIGCIIYEKEGLLFHYYPIIGGYINEVSIFGHHKAVTEEKIGLGCTVQSVYDTYGPAELKGAKGTAYMFAVYDGIKFGFELQNQGRLIPKDERKIVMITVF